MRLNPSSNSSLETECLYGEEVNILDEHSNWFLCNLKTDNYKGWVKKNAVGKMKPTTHRVYSIRTHVFKDKDVKSGCKFYLPMGSKLPLTNIKEGWAEISLSEKENYSIGYVPVKHLVRNDFKIFDWVSVAEKMLEIPYKWGGRDTIAIDCSALIQLSYQTSGQEIPRNSSDQINIKKKKIMILII